MKEAALPGGANINGRKAFFLALVLACLFAAQAYLGNQNKSLTWDEPSYIAAGYTYLKWGDFRLNPSHPPLMQDLAALPLMFMDLHSPEKENPSFRHAENPVVEFGYQFLFERGNDFRRITWWSRMAVLLFGTFLVVAIYLWGAALYGHAPALLAASVASLCPNLLAHAKVATEDLGCSVLMFAAVWMLWRSLRVNRLRNWLFCGIASGLSLISKYTALLLGPIFLILATGYWLMNRERIRLPELLKGGTVVAGISFLIIGSAYNFSFDYSLYLKGLGQLYSDYSDDRYYYLYGKIFDDPIWYYYLAAFLVKVPAPTILLLSAAIICSLREPRFREASLFLLVPVACILLVTFFDRHNLGLRRILPVFPFLLLLIASVAAERTNKWKSAFIGLMLLWLFVEAWHIYPHHLSYFNNFAGGPKRGPYLLDDSNIDWGEDLPALARWQEKNYRDQPIKLFYFGTADPVSYGVNAMRMDKSDMLSPSRGIYAVSAHHLVFFRMISVKEGYDVDWLTKYQPIAYAGNSIYIYRFD